MNAFGADEILLGEALYRTEAHLVACCELYGIGRVPDALLQAARPMTDVLPWLETEARSAGDALQDLYTAAAAIGAQVRGTVPPRRLRRALEPVAAARDRMMEAVVGPGWDRPDYRASVALALLGSASEAYRRGVEGEVLGDYQSAYALVAVAQELLEEAGAGKVARLDEALGAIAVALPAVEPPERLARPDDLDRLVGVVVTGAVEELGAKEARRTLEDSLRKVDRLLGDVLNSYERGLGPLAARLAASLFVRSYDPIRRDLSARDPDAEARLTGLLGFELRTAINENAEAARVRELATEAHDLLVGDGGPTS
ncbi:MAG TPA: hypothetical protein VJ927_09090 [Actinomycetota bacterium]|nr:hypothetical protein [Actinomycetota bacterium]